MEKQSAQRFNRRATLADIFMSTTSCSLPPLPRLVLRVGFAGNRILPSDSTNVARSLESIFEALAQRLAEIGLVSEGDPDRPPSRDRHFYSREKPLLRLITGLCEGADHLAAQAHATVREHPKYRSHIDTELAGVIPFDLATYRSTRPIEFLDDFDQQAAHCAYILSLDGIYEKPHPDTPRAKDRRSRAYRAQSAILLRHADILIAANDPDSDGRAGGTMETVRAALDFEMPVVFVHLSSGKISLIEPGDDLGSALVALEKGEGNWLSTLQDWVTTIVATPVDENIVEHEVAGYADHDGHGDHGEKLLTEFFHDDVTPSYQQDSNGRLRRKLSVGERIWLFFEGWFRSGPDPKSDPTIEPYATWRSRSTALNYHYSGLYRGAFLLNYLLAAMAVFFAALSLVLLGYSSHTSEAGQKNSASHTAAGELVQGLVGSAIGSPTRDENETPPSEPVATTHDDSETTQNERDAAASSAHTPSWLFPTLLILGTAKLWCVWRIFSNTHRANHGDWNDKAIDYRYLAERLRTMYYLPRIGSFQPPMAAPPQYASRVARQSSVDWLMEALVRSTSPASLAATKKTAFTFPERAYEVTLLKLEPLALLQDMKDRWIQEQAVYHSRNARTMDRIHCWAENWGKVFNVAVIGIVAVDIVICLATISGKLPDNLSTSLHEIAPWLVFLTAILPAAVASLNGIRFQSECRRLAERSAVMRTLLIGRFARPSSSVHSTRWSQWLDRIWHRPIAFIRVLFPFANQTTTSAISTVAGGKLAGADRLLSRLRSTSADPATDPGSWTPEVLRFAESVADVFVQEVAEWTVLYAKEVPEP
jgi:hypothetical protein